MFGMLGAIAGIAGIAAVGAVPAARVQGVESPPGATQRAPRFKVTPECPGQVGADGDGGFGIVSFEVDRQTHRVWMTWQAFDGRGRPRDEGRESLSSCTVVDDAHWRCGGQTLTFSGLTSVGETHAMEDGRYRDTPTHVPPADPARRCRVRVAPR
jgi:hypothetical protein